jgi:four helix bundle protein
VAGSFRELRVWRAAIELAEEIYRVTALFPREERYGLSSQMQRAAVSVAANIAEGHARQHRAEFLRFLSFSQASLAELETHAEIARRIDYLGDEQYTGFVDRAAVLGRQLKALRKALRSQGLISDL